MNTTRLSQARRLFFHDMVDAKTARHNARMWARAVKYLQQSGKWLLAQPVEKVRA
jgi:hypothetical protein